jgi:hypothetical protein
VGFDDREDSEKGSGEEQEGSKEEDKPPKKKQGRLQNDLWTSHPKQLPTLTVDKKGRFLPVFTLLDFLCNHVCNQVPLGNEQWLGK